MEMFITPLRKLFWIKLGGMYDSTCQNAVIPKQNWLVVGNIRNRLWLILLPFVDIQNTVLLKNYLITCFDRNGLKSLLIDTYKTFVVPLTGARIHLA